MQPAGLHYPTCFAGTSDIAFLHELSKSFVQKRNSDLCQEKACTVRIRCVPPCLLRGAVGFQGDWPCLLVVASSGMFYLASVNEC